MGWGDLLGKLFDWIPGREEHRRNRIEELERKIDGIAKRRPFTTRDARELEFLTEQLRRLRQKAKNG